MNYLKINNFKCFKDTSILLNGLTILAGANGNGKSSVIQALLFYRLTIEMCSEHLENEELGYVLNENSIGKKIPLNNHFLLSLGNSSSIINKNNNSNIISVGLFSENHEFILDFEADLTESQLSLTLKSINRTSEYDFQITQKEFYYLNAERLGPRIFQNIKHYNFPNAGWQGETVAQLISEKSGYLSISKERHFHNTTNAGIEFQVNEWLNFIMPSVRISAKQNRETFTSQIQIENFYIKGDPTISTNVGFGISYLLPIIANGLIARKGSYFIVENPEAHLHPAAQSRVGRFLGMVANSGVNVIIETHSDHIINGLQIAVAKNEIPSNCVTINYFSSKSESNHPEIQSISFSEKGELDDWPRGFFDQTQVDFSELFKIRKSE